MVDGAVADEKAFLILTREGRAMALTTAGNRKTGEGEQERAALHKSMLWPTPADTASKAMSS